YAHPRHYHPTAPGRRLTPCPPAAAYSPSRFETGQRKELSASPRPLLICSETNLLCLSELQNSSACFLPLRLGLHDVERRVAHALLRLYSRSVTPIGSVRAH